MRVKVPFFTLIIIESTQYYIFFFNGIHKIRITLLGLRVLAWFVIIWRGIDAEAKYETIP